MTAKIYHEFWRLLVPKINVLVFPAGEIAIFIDNAYKEREIVQQKYKIPVFDVEGIEVLLNW